jgi:glutamate dehydrogenase (NAD(P)+)
MSAGELERLTRRFAIEIAPIIGPMSDIPAPDVNTTPQVMAWFMDTYSAQAGRQSPAGIVTASRWRSAGRWGAPRPQGAASCSRRWRQ